MIDKFIHLTHRILKSLSIEYTMFRKEERMDDKNLTTNKYDISYKGSNPIMAGVIQIYDIVPDYHESHISISAFTHLEDTEDMLKNILLENITNITFSHMSNIKNILLEDITNITFDYMSIINRMFNLGEKHIRDYENVLYASIYPNETNKSILDEFLAYTDEELKLYINML